MDPQSRPLPGTEIPITVLSASPEAGKPLSEELCSVFRDWYSAHRGCPLLEVGLPQLHEPNMSLVDAPDGTLELDANLIADEIGCLEGGSVSLVRDGKPIYTALF